MTEVHDRHLRTHKRFDGTECGYTTPRPGNQCRKCGCVIGTTSDGDRPWPGPTSRGDSIGAVRPLTEINKLIEKTERLMAAATQGKWQLDSDGDVISRFPGGQDACVAEQMIESDAKLIAHAPAALRALIDEVKRLQGFYQLACCAIDESTVCPECKSRESASVCTKCEHQWGD